ncbi:MAG: hypothetical protein PHV42_04390 [Candidatus Pacebacteria bacterium]|nr:hypothetical protein [Candidatus Paceibacterota bacterium]
MILTKKSALSGKVHQMNLPISAEVYQKGLQLWENGAYIQDAFPWLSADEKEFIKTGITPEEWKEFIYIDEEET